MKRDYITTDLGLEARCAKCREFWPVDREFYYIQNGKPHSWCNACYIADRIAKGTSGRTGCGTVRNDHARAA